MADLWRTGRSVGRTIYRQVGADASKRDELVGMLDTPELAAFAVAAMNAASEAGRHVHDSIECGYELVPEHAPGNRRAAAAVSAAYDALIPHTQHAQIRHYVAGMVVPRLIDMLADRGHDYVQRIAQDQSLAADIAIDLREQRQPPRIDLLWLVTAIQTAAAVLAEGDGDA